MISKTVKYLNIDDEPITETVYFNLTAAEIARMEVTWSEGGFHQHLMQIMRAGDNAKLFEMFELLIKKSYGRRTDDKRFVKRDEWSEEFLASEAFSEVFMQLAASPETAADFFNGIFPKNLTEKIEALKLQSGHPLQMVTDNTTTSVQDDRPAWIREDREPTRSELMSMTQPQLQAAMLRRVTNQSPPKPQS